MRSLRHRSAARLGGVCLAIVLAGVSAAGAARPQSSPRVRTIDSRTHRALLDLYALDTRLEGARHDVAALTARTRELRVEESRLVQQLDATKRTLAISQQQLGDNLAMLYKQGDVSALAVVLGSESLDDAVTRLDDLNRVADQSRRVVAVTAGARSHLETLRTTFVARRAELRVAVAAARSRTTSLEAARSDRLRFISSLRRERSIVIAKIEATALRVERKSNVLQAAALADTPVVSTATAPAAAAGRTITVSSTGYALSGHTATGMPVGWGVVAVDPAIIPLGTRLTIPGYGEAVAADTGGAVHGNMIDIWFPTLAQAHAWGRRTVTITLH